MKPILCFCLCLLSAGSFCQVKVGVQAGYNYTGFTGNDIPGTADYYYHASSLSASNAGIISSIPLAKRLWLQPSLLLNEKGVKEKSGGGFLGHYYNTHLHIYYAHLPMQVMYTFINKKQWQVSAGAGGFISKGIWGTSKQSFTDYDSTGQRYTVHTSNQVHFTNDLYNYYISNKRNVKPWDYGYTVAAIAGWKHWQLKASYDFGVTDVVGQEDHHTRVFSLSAGYYFTKKKKQHTGVNQL